MLCIAVTKRKLFPLALSDPLENGDPVAWGEIHGPERCRAAFQDPDDVGEWASSCASTHASTSTYMLLTVLYFTHPHQSPDRLFSDAVKLK